MWDLGVPSLSGSCGTFTVTVLGIPEESPVFSQEVYIAYVDEISNSAPSSTAVSLGLCTYI